MNGFDTRVIAVHWIVAAAIMTGLLMFAEHNPTRYAVYDGLVLVVGLAACGYGLVRARGPFRDDIVTVATVVLANTLGLAMVFGAVTEGDGPRAASYQNLIEVSLAGFGYLLVIFARIANSQRRSAPVPADEQPVR